MQEGRAKARLFFIMKLQSLNVKEIVGIVALLGGGGTAGAVLSSDESSDSLRALSDRVLVIETKIKIKEEGEQYEKICNVASASR